MEEEPFSDDAQRNIAAISGSSSFTQRSGSLDEILSSWTKVINYIRARKISIASYLQEGDPINLEGGTLTIGFAKEFQFHKEVLESPDNKKLIETAIKDMLGKELTVLLEVTESAASGIHSANNDLAGVDGLAEEDKAGGETMPEDEDPIVKKALELFNGKLVRSRNAEESMK
jgi:hypothetical protein